jgi:hypothetical protein
MRLAFAVRRSPFGVRRLAFGVLAKYRQVGLAGCR